MSTMEPIRLFDGGVEISSIPELSGVDAASIRLSEIEVVDEDIRLCRAYVAASWIDASSGVEVIRSDASSLAQRLDDLGGAGGRNRLEWASIGGELRITGSRDARGRITLNVTLARRRPNGSGFEGEAGVVIHLESAQMTKLAGAIRHVFKAE